MGTGDFACDSSEGRAQKWTWRELNPITCVYKTLAPNLAGPDVPAMSGKTLCQQNGFSRSRFMTW